MTKTRLFAEGTYGIKEAYQQNTEVIENSHPKENLKAQVEVLLHLIFLVEIRKESAQDLGDQ